MMSTMDRFERPISETSEASGREKVLAAAEFLVRREEENLAGRAKLFSRITNSAFAATIGIGGVALAQGLGAELPVQGQETFIATMASQALMWGGKFLSDQARSKLETFVGTYGGLSGQGLAGQGFREVTL